MNARPTNNCIAPVPMVDCNAGFNCAKLNRQGHNNQKMPIKYVTVTLT